MIWKGIHKMGKIYRRSTLVDGVKAKKKKNEKNRKRNVIQNFRISPEEKKLLEERIALSGMSKSEFFIGSCLHQKINVTGNIKTFKAMKEQMKRIDEHLCEIQKSEELDIEILESLRMILELLNGIFGKESMQHE